MLKAIATFCVLAFTSYEGLKLIHHVVRRKMIRQQTGMSDLELLGTARKDGQKIRGTAVICGGSIGGLASARICHDHFERVIIVEPEAWLSTADACPVNVSELQHKRSRLMQWESYQGTQVWPRMWFQKLFQNFERECKASDIPLVPANIKYHFSGLKLKTPQGQYNGDLPKHICSGRPGFETLLRRLVIGQEEYPNIQQIHGTVIGYEKDPENPTYLSQVLVRQGDQEIIAIPATLVIDCTGLAMAGSKFLRRLGFGIGDSGHGKERSLDDLKMKYDQVVHYSTYSIPLTDEQNHRLPPEARNYGVVGIYFPDSRAGERRVLLAQKSDKNIMQLCSGNWGSFELPNNLNEYETFARSLRCQVPVDAFWYQLFEVLKETEDSATLKNVRIPPSTYTPFHLAANMPSNWVALGDSVMHVNPIFGQGIAKAFLGTASLNTLLHEVHPDCVPKTFAKTFFDMQATKIEPLWDSVKAVDYNFDSTEPLPGETLDTDSGKRWFFRHVQILATKDDHIASVWWHVRNFLVPPFDFFHPDIVLKVFREAIKGSLLPAKD
ncbi:hypothetical protein M378DRAFT_88651 [Amanita muscaria Koide BX008]|uniref:Uncharacterized protein n=1 Tax=Amanita muscaria (strain Koide BX008) TaxID=946122 RepID=A0A0C2WJQ3_AMAMK|nr:hypothetical protein M378DRAFT_88651 [Amanita muscaria Koide BX008]